MKSWDCQRFDLKQLQGQLVHRVMGVGNFRYKKALHSNPFRLEWQRLLEKRTLLESGLSTCVFLFELLNTPFSIHKCLLTCVERVRSARNFNTN